MYKNKITQKQIPNCLLCAQASRDHQNIVPNNFQLSLGRTLHFQLDQIIALGGSARCLLDTMFDDEIITCFHEIPNFGVFYAASFPFALDSSAHVSNRTGPTSTP